MQDSSENDFRTTALKRSTIAISSVVLMEVILGLAVGSLAIVSDGLHATLDAVTTLALLVATRISLKPPDEEHMYGHEKFESIGGLVGGIALVGIALLVIYEAVLRITQNQTINSGLEYFGFVAIAYTFCIDFFRVGTFMKARKSESSTMKAGFYHATADLGSTIIALLGFGLATQGFGFGDSLASIVLGAFLTYLSVKLVWSSGIELSDTISKDIVNKVRREILSTKGISKSKDLKIRRAGDKTFVRATVQVPDYMNLEDAHNLASKLEANIKNSLGNADVAIHVEPHEAEMRTEKIVERIATGVGDVKEVHEITVVYTDGKLYITLHARVNPKLSVQETHDIAEKIENEIFGTVRDVENVTVHIEPFSAKLQKGSAVDEREINEIIHRTAEAYQQAFRIKRILTYVANKKRYINIDGYFTKQISIEAAHKIASQIEDSIRQHFEETTVTVHMEPE